MAKIMVNVQKRLCHRTWRWTLITIAIIIIIGLQCHIKLIKTQGAESHDLFGFSKWVKAVITVARRESWGPRDRQMWRLQLGSCELWPPGRPPPPQPIQPAALATSHILNAARLLTTSLDLIGLLFTFPLGANNDKSPVLTFKKLTSVSIHQSL